MFCLQLLIEPTIAVSSLDEFPLEIKSIFLKHCCNGSDFRNLASTCWDFAKLARDEKQKILHKRMLMELGRVTVGIFEKLMEPLYTCSEIHLERWTHPWSFHAVRSPSVFKFLYRRLKRGGCKGTWFMWIVGIDLEVKLETQSAKLEDGII